MANSVPRFSDKEEEEEEEEEEDDDDQEPLDVLDLPQLYQRPSAATLLSVLDDLSSAPPSWETRSFRDTTASRGARKKVKGEGVPSYLTKIVSSPLAWIEDDDDKERIWEAAAQRLSERSGRTAMGDLTRTFSVPLQAAGEIHVAEEERTASVADAYLASKQGADEAMLEIVLHEPALTADHLGLKTWAASYLLAKRLRILAQQLRLPPHTATLELGAGTGLVGLAAAAVLHTHVLLTDLSAIAPNLERNVRANADALAAHGGSAKTAVLDWSDPGTFSHSSFPLILVADPIYSPEHPRLLVQAIGRHLSREGGARVAIELPLREAFGAERRDLRERMEALGLRVLEEGEEVGFDDWSEANGGEEDGLAEVRCWWAVWGWR